MNFIAASLEPLKVIVGAGGTSQPGWLSLEEADLDITDSMQWTDLFLPNSIDAILTEHVLEHLDFNEAQRAVKNFFTYLRPGGYARIAVPDGFHPNAKYIAWVMPGTGWNGDDHKQLFTYRSLSQLLTQAGFDVRLREYWDESGWFHADQWSEEDGIIKRCSRGLYPWMLSCLIGANYTSLIIDATKSHR